MAESVEHRPRAREIVGANPDQVKPMTYKIGNCRFLSRCSALLGQHYKNRLEFALSQVVTRPNMTLDVARTLNNKPAVSYKSY